MCVLKHSRAGGVRNLVQVGVRHLVPVGVKYKNSILKCFSNLRVVAHEEYEKRGGELADNFRGNVPMDNIEWPKKSDSSMFLLQSYKNDKHKGNIRKIMEESY